MTRMFYCCYNLEKIYVSNKFVTTSIPNENIKSSRTFEACNNLVGGLGTKYSHSHLNVDYAHIDEGPNNPGYFTLKQ